MISGIISFAIIGLCFLIFARSRGLWRTYEARQKGILGRDSQPTMFDVKRLIQDGHQDLAVFVYAEIYKVGKRESIKAVEELAKHIPVKKPKRDAN